MRQTSKSSCFATASLAVIAALAAGATPAAAQNTPPATAPQANSDGDITVTGSRIPRRDFESASPIQTVLADDVRESSTVSIDQYLAYLPQFGASFGQSSSNSGNFGGANVNLHYLGANRTLTLVDGRRMATSESGGSTDVSTIPVALIQSVEIITGGASAVYGSDAIAGVVNFKLNDRFEGLRVSGLAGITDRHDGARYSIDAVYGWRAPSGRGGFVAFAGYNLTREIDAATRPATAVSNVVTFVNGAPVISQFVANGLPNGAFIPAVTNLPTQAAVDAVFATYGVAPGTVLRTGAIGFNNDNTLFSNAPLRNLRDGTARDPYYTNFNPGVYSQLPSERISLGLLADWEFADWLTVYGRFFYVDSTVTRSINPLTITVNVPRTNPFVPAALQTILASRPTPGATFSVSRILNDFGNRTARYEAETFSGVIGARGSFAEGWTYDIYFSRNRIDRDEVAVGGAYITARLNTLIAAADGGASLCAGGLDLFGIAPISQACVDYLSYQPRTFTRSDQTVVEGTVTGSLFPIWGGDVKVALGAAYRRDSFTTVGDPQINAGAITGGLRTSSSIASRFEVREVFGEIFIPLLSEVPLAHRLEASFGYRRSDYTVSRDADAYKAELVYAPIRQLTFRGTYQRAVRAPGASELFLPTTPSNESSTQDPCSVTSAYRLGNIAGVTPANVRALCLTQGVPAVVIDTFVGPTAATGTRVGNPNLSPEIADTYTVGAVIRPDFGGSLFRNLSLSVDYWDISLNNAISQLSFNDSLTRCFNFRGANPNYAPTNAFCQNFGRNANGQLTNAVVTFTNIGGLKVAGIDFQLDWRIPIEKWNGSFDINFSGSYLTRVQRQAIIGDPFDNLLGSIGNIPNSAFPKFRSTLSTQLTIGDFDIGARWRHMSAMIGQATRLSPTVLSLGSPAMDYLDASIGWRLESGFRLRFGVDNLTDRQPPILSAQVQTNTDPTVFDVIGRRYYVRFEAQF